MAIASIAISTLITACGQSNDRAIDSVPVTSNQEAITVGTILPMDALTHLYADVVVDGKNQLTTSWSVGSSAYHYAGDASNVFLRPR